jgi:Spy/CpxP family protein refolding chaperone
MKHKCISALVGIGAAAMLAIPGVASASTTSQAHPSWQPTHHQHHYYWGHHHNWWGQGGRGQGGNWWHHHRGW